MQQVRMYEMPDCQMVSSGVGMFGEEKPEAFGKWMSSQIKEPVSLLEIAPTIAKLLGLEPEDEWEGRPMF